MNHQLNWDFDEFKRTKIPNPLKYPANATFDAERKGSAYQVTVTGIWFSDIDPSLKQSHITLESIGLKKNGLAFRKSKKTTKILYMLDQNLNRMFTNKAFGKEVRF